MGSELVVSKQTTLVRGRSVVSKQTTLVRGRIVVSKQTAFVQGNQWSACRPLRHETFEDHFSN